MSGRRVSLTELAAHCRRMAETDPVRERAPAWLAIADEVDAWQIQSPSRQLDLTWLDDDQPPPAETGAA